VHSIYVSEISEYAFKLASTLLVIFDSIKVANIDTKINGITHDNTNNPLIFNILIKAMIPNEELCAQRVEEFKNRFPNANLNSEQIEQQRQKASLNFS